MVRIPILLLHEMLEWLIQSGKICLATACALAANSGQQRLHDEFCRKSGLPANKTVAIGQHNDGMPFQKSESLEITSWNLPAVPWAERVFHSCIEKQLLCKCGCFGRHTINAILSIFVWSLRLLYVGKKPVERHDGTQFTRYDKQCGRRNYGKDTTWGWFARLCEVRGDWMNYKFLFGFKGWTGENICYCCAANKSTMPYWDFSSKALWRAHRLTTYAFMQLMRANGISNSVLFDAPGFILSMIMVDVLHCLDLGVSQEALGNLFHYFMTKMSVGKNKSERLFVLWRKIKDYYDRSRPPSRLNKLTEEMVKRSGKSPKLRAKGAETRHLVPFSVELCDDLCKNEPTVFHETLLSMFKHLYSFYQRMGKEPFDKRHASESAKSFLLLYAQVSKDTAEDLWKIKPKFHMMQELAEFQTESSGDPSRFWAYADESFVGAVGKIAFSRGGKRLADTTPRNVIAKYRGLD